MACKPGSSLSKDGRYLWNTIVDLCLGWFIIMITYIFQGKEGDSDEMIAMDVATSLSSEEVAHSQETGMIGTATAADDEEVLVILRSMKSAVSHFVGDKKCLSA